MAAARRRAKAGPARTAAGARETVEDTVANPYGNGTDRVVRVIDTLELLARRGAIDARQYRAGLRYRDAWDRSLTVPATMDLERVSGGGGGAGVAAAAFQAAHDLAAAQSALAALDRRRAADAALAVAHGAVLASVVARGHTLTDVAVRLAGGAPKRRHREIASRALGDSLAALADLWEPVACADPRAAVVGAR